MTADLFATAPQPVPKLPKKGVEPRRRAVFNKLKEPYGEPDKRGRYWYEKYNEALEKLPVKQQDILRPLLLSRGFNHEDTKSIARMLNKWLEKTEHSKYGRDDFVSSNL